MGGVLFGLLIFACAIALVLLFFPIKFKIEFGADETGGGAKFYIFKKKFYTWEKFRKGKGHDSDESLDVDDVADELHASDDSHDKDSAAPEFVATAPAKPVEKKAAEPAKAEPKAAEPVKTDTTKVETAPVEKATEETASKDVAPEESAPAPVAEKPTEEKPAKEEKPAPVEAPKPVAVTAPKADDAKPAKKEKPEKRNLTDFEFWTLVLTPDLDERGFRYVKRILIDLVRLFNVKFDDCFVEGIRADYKTMGYGAAFNGVIKGFPFLKDWDIRMDWCNEKELRVQGNILARTNLCRVLFFLLEFAVLAGIVFLIFWRRRARVLKTGELPELGFVRQKIRAFFVED